MSEKRRDEVIAAAIFASFRNQEFGTRFQLPADYSTQNLQEDARGIDIVVEDRNGRKKQLQIKGVYIQRSIQRRRHHATRGFARVLGRRSQRLIKEDSKELTKIMKNELAKIIHDYSGLFLIIHVIADLATQTSMEIAIRKSQEIVTHLKAKEVWFLRHIPARAFRGKESVVTTHTFMLLKVFPDKHSYCFTFAL